MDQQSALLASAVAITCDSLTDDELAAIYNAATAGFNPKMVRGYAKAARLFTEQNGTKMHPAALDALGQVVTKRLAS